MNEFTKADVGKLLYDLLPPMAIEEVVKVLTFGTAKYAPDNWRKCDDLSRYRFAAMRHFEAYRKGEILDPETELPHLAHAICNLIFLLELTHVDND